MQSLDRYYPLLSQWFPDIPSEEIHKILIRIFDTDEIFVTKRRGFRYVYILLDGICNVISELDNGSNVITLKLTKGDIIGVSESILNCQHNIASVKACTRLTVAEIENKVFSRWLDTFPSFSRFVLKNMIVRLHYTADLSANCQTSTSKINLAKYLLDRYNVELTSHPADYSGSVKIQETHEMIGNYLGLSSRTVERQLRALVSDGLLSTRHGKIHISPEQYQELMYLVTSNL